MRGTCCSLPRFFLPLWQKDSEGDPALSRKYLIVLRWEKSYWQKVKSVSHKRCGSSPWVGKIPWRRAWQPTLVFLPEESHGQRRLAGYSTESQRVRHNWSNVAHTHMRNIKSSLYCLSLNILSWISIAFVLQKKLKLLNRKEKQGNKFLGGLKHNFWKQKEENLRLLHVKLY